MNRPIALALLLVPAGAAAQQGTILYERAVKYEFEIPETLAENMKAMVPANSVTPMALHFSASAWILRPVAEPEAPVRVSDRVSPADLARRLKAGSTSRSDREALLETFVDPVAGTVVETRELLGRTFLIEGPRPTYAWKLTGEQSTFLGYAVQKATAVADSTTIEAWFTPEIPVPAGPGTFGGLPGMILVVSVNDGHTTYTATEVGPGDVEEGVLVPPEDGERVGREEYERIVEEKLEELRATRAGRIRR
jgi:hypothetical protein